MLNINKFNKKQQAGHPFKKGFSLTEAILSTLVLVMVMMGAAFMSEDFLDVTSNNSLQLMNVSQAREITQSITYDVTNAGYIYPPGVTIAISTTHPDTGQSWNFNISTNDSVAILFSDGTDLSGNPLYGLVVYFMEADGERTTLYHFVDNPSYSWAENSCPAENLTSFTGVTSGIITDVNRGNTTLNYVFNYENGLTDEILQGQISGVAIDNPEALIKGIEWEIAQGNIEDQTIRIKGLSRNVPRFIE